MNLSASGCCWMGTLSWMNVNHSVPSTSGVNIFVTCLYHLNKRVDNNMINFLGIIKFIDKVVCVDRKKGESKAEHKNNHFDSIELFKSFISITIPKFLFFRFFSFSNRCLLKWTSYDIPLDLVVGKKNCPRKFGKNIYSSPVFQFIARKKKVYLFS